MTKFMISITKAAAVAAPTAAIAANTDVSSNGTTNEVIGYCTSAGNYNLKHRVHPGYTSVGEYRSDIAPRSMDDRIGADRESVYCGAAGDQVEYPAPSRP